ncbi:FecR family protein [Microbulbifer thermotolerans]|uniref:FecR family protein n=1 Tax=Microbulbifer thermotolerans TaxID=252514 RepID=A0A143HNF4_MICTH|nr:FecR family protein [Microbulbifer thermotolerans]AMX03228.1 iron acquisition-like protein [Microbulbifer thermotolerans]MCX2780057.1 FecR family protein [Microbulbifer thermotolerans]MCX2783536.1 FecR family protein [Microbulbifer thermotolerans]MCX2796266.1 FecR family protein [Microbulbifer thermotolerans]MCX2802083.1 FecR family protein [Microbulbifer thermotolerans]
MTTASVQEAPNDEQLDQACAWIARLRSDKVSSTDRREFAKWLSVSAANRRAFDQMAELWGDLGALAHLPIDQLFPESRPSPKPASEQQKNARTAATDSRRFISRWTISGGLVAACLAIALWLGNPWSFGGLREQTYVTQVGETRTVTLADGTLVQLNTNTELRVAYSREERHTRLLRGEAYFDVVRQTARPFTVAAGKANIRVLGTEFNVERNPENTRVSVTDGVVAVSEAESSSGLHPESVKLTKNQKISVSSGGLSEVGRTSAEEALDWTRGVLVFEHTPLAEVLEELNRYLKVPAAADPRVRDRLVSGTFELSDPDNTLKAIAAALDLYQDDSDPKLTLLSPQHI